MLNVYLIIYIISHTFFIFRLPVWDLRAHMIQGWTLCTLILREKVDGRATEHTRTEHHLLMEDTGSIPHIHTLIPEEASFQLQIKMIISHKAVIFIFMS